MGSLLRETYVTLYHQLSDSLGVEITPLPSLPEPRSGMASARIENVLYLIGGRVNGKLSNTVLSLDLKCPQKGWREETLIRIALSSSS